MIYGFAEPWVTTQGYADLNGALKPVLLWKPVYRGSNPRAPTNSKPGIIDEYLNLIIVNLFSFNGFN